MLLTALFSYFFLRAVCADYFGLVHEIFVMLYFQIKIITFFKLFGFFVIFFLQSLKDFFAAFKRYFAMHN